MIKQKSYILSFLLIFLMIVFPALVSGQGNDPPNLLAQKFISQFTQGNMEQAVDENFSERMKQIIGSSLSESLVQIDNLQHILGPFEEVEFIREEKISTRLNRYIYFAYTETSPIAFYLYYYKTKEGWQLISFTFDTDFEDLLPINQ